MSYFFGIESILIFPFLVSHFSFPPFIFLFLIRHLIFLAKEQKRGERGGEFEVSFKDSVLVTYTLLFLCPLQKIPKCPSFLSLISCLTCFWCSISSLVNPTFHSADLDPIFISIPFCSFSFFPRGEGGSTMNVWGFGSEVQTEHGG